MTSSTSTESEPVASPLARFFLNERINFLVTNRLPRRYATMLAGWYSRIRSRPLTRISLAVWSLFADDLELHESADTDFRSLHECFTRALKPGVRPIDPAPGVVVSPCDAVVGAHGRVRGAELFQAKGLPYRLEELLGEGERATRYRDGYFVTLRLKANMYHRFHAPEGGRIRGVTYVSGDTWNVNPIALRRVERLFCRNERAIMELEPDDPHVRIALVPVAAILVASIRFNFVETPLTLAHRGWRDFSCDVQVQRGEELGRFEAGSTIILFASGPVALCDGIQEGTVIRMGQRLLARTDQPHTSDESGGKRP